MRAFIDPKTSALVRSAVNGNDCEPDRLVRRGPPIAGLPITFGPRLPRPGRRRNGRPGLPRAAGSAQSGRSRVEGRQTHGYRWGLRRIINPAQNDARPGIR